MQTIEISEKMKLFKEGLYSYEQIKEDTINFLYNYFNKYFKNPLYEDDSFIALTKILENADKMINNFKLYDYSCYKNYLVKYYISLVKTSRLNSFKDTKKIELLYEKYYGDMLELKEDNEFYFDKKYDYDLIKKNLAAAVQCPIRKLGDYKNRKKVLYLILKLSNCINLEQLDIIYDIMNFYKPQIEEYMNLLNKEIGAKKALLETLKNRKLKLYLSLKIKYLECDKEVIRKKIQAIDKRISRFKMAPSSITIAKIFNIDPTYINKLIIIAKKKIVC